VGALLRGVARERGVRGSAPVDASPSPAGRTPRCTVANVQC